MYFRRVALLLSLWTLCCSAFCQQTSVPPSATSAESPRYQLAPGDVVLIRFFFNPELNDETQVRPDGTVSLQLIGEVLLAGRTIRDVSEELERRYKPEVKSPRVTVQVRSYAGQKVYVTGEVTRPGTINLIGGQDVMSAIAEAGGVRETGKFNSAILVRKGADGRVMVRKLQLNIPNQVAEKLQPFDVVVVPPRAIIKVDRFVEEYIRGVVPANLNAGFQYLYNNTSSAVSVIPF
jgi:protein involved in polysaccharide export with SLBB domain